MQANRITGLKWSFRNKACIVATSVLTFAMFLPAFAAAQTESVDEAATPSAAEDEAVDENAQPETESEPADAPTPETPEASQPAAETPAAAPPTLIQKLQQPVDVDFLNTPLADAAKALSDRCKFSIIVDTAALKSAGLSDETVSIQAKQIPLYVAFDLLLPQGVSYRQQGEVLLITSDEAAEAKMTTKVYNVATLINYDELAAPGRSDLEELVDLLQEMIEPQSWEDFGGSGSIRRWKNQLVIRQTTVNHLKLEVFMAKLEAALANKFDAGVFIPKKSILDTPVQVEFEKTPLGEVLSFLSDATKTEILVDAQSLADIGLDLSGSVSLQASASLGNVLSKLGSEELGYYLAGDVIVICGAEDALYLQAPSILDTRGLLTPKVTDYSALLEKAELVDMVTSVIDPSSWDYTGGMGTAYLYRDMLVLGGQTPQNTSRVNGLLEKLAAGGDKLAGPDWEAKKVKAEFVEVPLGDVAKFYSDKLGVPVKVIDIEEGKISLTVEAAAKDVFQLIADQADCTWWLEGDTVWFGIDPPMETRVYSVLPVLGPEPRPTERNELEDLLYSVDPDSWDYHGGTGSLWQVSGYCCVSQSAANQRQVKELLSKLRAAQKAAEEIPLPINLQPEVETPTDDVPPEETPAEESPAEETPEEKTPAEETRAEEAPAK